MAGFFKKLFGGGNDNEDVFQRALDREQKWIVAGAEIAQDCFQNGLSQGEIVRLSDITNFIKQEYPHTILAVKNGFLQQMNFYVQKDIVVALNGESDDIVFVHKNYLADVLKR